MLFGREISMWMGLFQAALALAVGFGLNLSPERQGLLMAFSAMLFAFITRQNVTPVAKLEAAGIDPNTLKKVAMFFLPIMLVGSLTIPACSRANPNTKPDAQAASYGAQVMQIVVDSKKFVIQGYAAKVIPEPVADTAMDFLRKATDASDKAASAIEAYHVATSDDLRIKFKTDAEAALKEVEILLENTFKLNFPDSTVSKVLELKKHVEDAIREARGQLSLAA